MQPILALQALIGDTRPDHLGKAVDVHGADGKALLDLAAHRIGPGLGDEDADLQRARARVGPLAAELIEDGEHVAWRHGDDLGLEIADQLHLAFGHAAGDRNHRAAEPLGPGMHAAAADEQAVAIGVVHHHARPPSRRVQRAGCHIRPDVQILERVTDNGRLAGGAGRSVDPGQLVARDRKHTERVIGAQILLGREREFRQIRQIVKIVRVHAGRVKRGAIMRHVGVGVAQRPGHARELQSGDLVTRRGLDRIQSNRHRLPST